MQVVRFFPEIFFIWIMIGNVTSFRIRDPSKIMTAGSNQEHNQNYQNQNYQINQIDDNFFLTTAVPDSLPTSTPGITIDENAMLTTLPITILTSEITEPLTTTSQSTSKPTTHQTTNEIQEETTVVTTLLTSTSSSSSATIFSTPESSVYTLPTSSSTSVETSSAATTTMELTSTTSNLDLSSSSLASTILSTMTIASNKPSTVPVTETTSESRTSTASPTESDSSDAIIFPDEDDNVSDTYVTFPPLIYQLISSQGQRFGYAVPGFVIPSEIKIYVNFPNSTIFVPGVIQATADTLTNKTTDKEAPKEDSSNKAPSGTKNITENTEKQAATNTEAPNIQIHVDGVSEENTSGEKTLKIYYSNKNAHSIQTPNDEARKEKHEMATNNKEILTSVTTLTEETLDTTLFTTHDYEVPNNEEAIIQTQSTTISTDILVTLSPNTGSTITETASNIIINDFIDTFKENIDLSHNTQNNDFGQNSGQFVGPTSIHKIKCEEYSSYFRNFKDVPKEQNSLPFQLFIVGGVGSEEKEFPHMAALGYGKGEEKQWLCGGSLISERFVLTAAHCLTSKQIGDVQIVRLGTTTLQTETLESMDYGIYRKIPHPRYVVGQQYNDIALIELDHPVKFTEFIRPICLDDENGYTGRKLIATGWGRIQATGSVSKDLQKVDLDYFPMTNANKSMQRYLSRIYRMA
ncbi:unnamed protein product [Acanthoscelides obtectus]|uniref:Peptidase S1 domain-containing protein n=2 Tax=Acanthoscelides obtectus TaxID=200917 RepID=A0A9P0PBE8_ACAOB|nr:unnamed protein product [Acanthoscelides obtectus]CAK1639569.1 Serine protease snake [Acanthoscelides obtectus]